MRLQLRELFLQDLQPLLLVGDVHHGRRELLGLEQLLQLGQLRLLLPVGDVEPPLHVHFIAPVLLLVSKGGIVKPDNLIYPPDNEVFVKWILNKDFLAAKAQLNLFYVCLSVSKLNFFLFGPCI